MSPTAETNAIDDGKWLTNEFLEDVLRNTDEDVTLVNKVIELAVGKGENYLGILYRIQVQFKCKSSDSIKTCHLIAKGLPDGDFIQKFLRETGLFNRELIVYERVLPAIYRLAESRLGDGLVPRLSARSYFTPRRNTLVMEDLKHQGFKMADRNNRFDLVHTRLVMKGLAQLHAMSAAVHRENPDIIGDLHEVMWCDSNKENMEQLLIPQLNGIVDMLKSWPGYEKIATKIEVMIPTAVDRCIEVCKLRKGGFHVMSHGDCWKNNIMFQYSEQGEPIDLRIVDFQMSRLASPAMDLSYFLYTSPQDAVRVEHMDEMLQEYHTHLCDTLSALGWADHGFTLQNLRDEMKRMLFFGFMAGVSILGVVLADSSEVPDFANIKVEDMQSGELNAFEKMHQNTRFKSAFKLLLTYFNEVGVFDP